jgi:hypothetical protein
MCEERIGERRWREGATWNEVREDLDVQMQRTWNIFSFLIHGFLLHGLKTGEISFELLQVVGWAREEPDDSHVSGGRSMTWSFDFGDVWDMLWEEKVIPFLCKSGPSGLKTA